MSNLFYDTQQTRYGQLVDDRFSRVFLLNFIWNGRPAQEALKVEVKQNKKEKKLKLLKKFYYAGR